MELNSISLFLSKLKSNLFLSLYIIPGSSALSYKDGF